MEYKVERGTTFPKQSSSTVCFVWASRKPTWYYDKVRPKHRGTHRKNSCKKAEPFNGVTFTWGLNSFSSDRRIASADFTTAIRMYDLRHTSGWCPRRTRIICIRWFVAPSRKDRKINEKEQISPAQCSHLLAVLQNDHTIVITTFWQ